MVNKASATEMSAVQLRALEVYCDSATAQTDYKPISINKVAEKLKEEGYTTSSSAVGRWYKKFDFKKYLDTQLQLILIEDEEKNTHHKALQGVVKKRLVDIDRNNSLTADCYELMELFAKQVAENYDRTNILKRDDIKIVKDIAMFTGGREDKLLDRIANTGSEKLSSEDLLKEFDTIDVDIEE